MLHVCIQDVTVGFMLLFSAHCLPARSFSRSPQRWKLLDPIIPPGHESSYSWEMKTTLPTVLILCPVISIYMDPLRNNWLASDLQQTLMRSKLQPPGYRYLKPASDVLGLKPWSMVGQIFKCEC